MVGRKLGQFKLIEEIGRGGMGVVYRARDESLDRDVAVKVLPADRLAEPQARKRFRREAHALSRLNHPHIATIHAFDSVEDVDFLVMEMVEGPSLDEQMAKAPLLEDEIIRICVQVCAALGEAHEQGIVHRDLKPSNVKLTDKGQVKVLDFGIAALLRPEASATPETLTEDDALAGTVPYMSPEQLLGRSPEPTADVWALGVMLYEAIAKVRPFTGDPAPIQMSAILNLEPAPLPSTTSDALRGVVQRCLQKDPQQRFKNAGEVRIALETIRPVSSDAIAPQPPPTRPRTWLYASAAVAVVAAAVIGWQMFGGWGTPSEPKVQSLVALPSTVDSDAADAYLRHAIPRTISNYLSDAEGILIKVPPTVHEFERLGGDAANLATAYDVGALVVSNLIVNGDALTLSVQLVEAGTRTLVWGEEFEGERDRYLDLVRQAARGVRTALLPKAEPAAAPDATRNSDAELARQRGLYHLDLFYAQGVPDHLDRASEAFQEALEQDPSFAEAAAGYAHTLTLNITRGGNPLEAIGKAETWARYAIQRDPRSSQAWLVLSSTQAMKPDGDPKTALEYAIKAAAFDPRNHYAHLAVAQTLSGASCELALAAYSEGPKVNPLDLNSPAAAAGLLSQIGRTDEAIVALDRVLETEPDLSYALLIKASVLVAAGDAAQATETFEHLQSLQAGLPFPPQFLAAVQDYIALASANASGADAAPHVAALVQAARGEGTPYPFWDRATQMAAPTLARLGYREEALRVLEGRLVKQIAEPYEMLLWNPSFETIRDDTRFAPALAASKSRFDVVVEVLERARERDELPAYLDRTLAELKRRLPAASG